MLFDFEIIEDLKDCIPFWTTGTINTFKNCMKHLKTLFKCICVIAHRRLKLNTTKSIIDRPNCGWRPKFPQK